MMLWYHFSVTHLNVAASFPVWRWSHIYNLFFALLHLNKDPVSSPVGASSSHCTPFLSLFSVIEFQVKFTFCFFLQGVRVLRRSSCRRPGKLRGAEATELTVTDSLASSSSSLWGQRHAVNALLRRSSYLHLRHQYHLRQIIRLDEWFISSDYSVIALHLSARQERRRRRKHHPGRQPTPGNTSPLMTFSIVLLLFLLAPSQPGVICLAPFGRSFRRSSLKEACDCQGTESEADGSLAAWIS